ncbi:ABC transporter substrate-binding protein [Aeromicrobium sp. CTD01-1L150]|uniref:ABC transporter substrate-binding protein n=1 Tax=Aeromicrobium sp. CTD01-1L150 TaxID=3341830 RepID=UPI0035C05454
MTRLRPLVGLVVAASLALTACGSSAGESGEGAWEYTSGDGETYTADEVPTRILAQGEAAAALIAHGIKPVGIFANEPVEESKALEGVDLDGIEIVGEAWGDIDAEKAAGLEPDLIVSGWWPEDEAYSGFSEGVEADSRKVAELAPVVGPTYGESAVTTLEGYEDLAVSLGADAEEPAIVQAKEGFEQAKERFQKVVAEKDDLTAMGVSPADDLLYVAVPEKSAELTDFVEWGLDVIDPDTPFADYPYWENLSWENADKYQPDLILLDDRTYESSLKTAEKQPTWNKIKAADAGAITPWPAFWMSTYAQYAEQLDQLSDAIEKADADLS